MYILIAVYIIGSFLAYAMLRVEHAASGEVYTKGQRILAVFLSFISIGLVIFLLVKSWVDVIAKSGYWSRPATDIKKPNELTKAA